MAASRNVFEMRNVSVLRGGESILRNVDWKIEKGQHWAILGGNGSGKTSLLKVLMGYLTPSEGEVSISGRESAVDHPEQEWDDWKRKIGFVSSSVAEMVEPTETAREVILAGRYAMVNYWHRDPAQAREDLPKVEKILKKVHGESIADRPWAYLSQGERQRVLIGRALMAPKLDVLILDEPCAGLDPMARENFLTFVEGLTEKGSFKSLILVTHHVEEIIPNITHALVMREGESISCGPKRTSLNSRSISNAFGGDLKLRSRLGRYRLYFGEDDPATSRIVV